MTLCCFCAQHEGRKQAPIATAPVSTNVPQAQQNSLQLALQKAPKYIQQYIRVDQGCDNASKQTRAKLSPRVTMFRTSFFIFPLCCCCLLLLLLFEYCVIKPPATKFVFSKYRWHSALCDGRPSRRNLVFFLLEYPTVTDVTVTSLLPLQPHMFHTILML